MEIKQILQQLNSDFFQRLAIKKEFPLISIDSDILTTKWLGYSSAREEVIAIKEQELGVFLPKSYKDFLMISNGFRNISPFIFNLYSIERIDWAYKIEDTWWLDLIESHKIDMSDDEYLVYGDKQRSPWFRPEYFRNSLKISDWGDACCLFLNPAIKHDGEWEVLFYATWFPGTERFRSFKEFLVNTHQSNKNLLKHNRD